GRSGRTGRTRSPARRSCQPTSSRVRASRSSPPSWRASPPVAAAFPPPLRRVSLPSVAQRQLPSDESVERATVAPVHPDGGREAAPARADAGLQQAAAAAGGGAALQDPGDAVTGVARQLAHRAER